MALVYHLSLIWSRILITNILNIIKSFSWNLYYSPLGNYANAFPAPFMTLKALYTAYNGVLCVLVVICVIHCILQHVFTLDVIDSIYLAIKQKKLA